MSRYRAGAELERYEARVLYVMTPPTISVSVVFVSVVGAGEDNRILRLQQRNTLSIYEGFYS